LFSTGKSADKKATETLNGYNVTTKESVGLSEDHSDQENAGDADGKG
jgi:hypothetical protein